MNERPRIYADFNNADESGRLRLNVRGSLADLARHEPRLEAGTEIVVHDEDLEALGVLERSDEEGIWVARID